MDDVNRLSSSSITNLHLHKAVDHYIEHTLYDQLHKHLKIKPQDDTNFLDATNVISADRTSVKIIYNNKNASCLDTHQQTIGRFHDANAPSPTRFKLAAAYCILVKINDFTTYPTDMLLPTASLTHELRLLGYDNNFISSIITRANRSRPHPIWNALQILTRR